MKMHCICSFCPVKLKVKRGDKDIPRVKYFSIPKDPILSKKWLKFCGKQNETTSSPWWKICSIHFKSEDLEESMAYRMGFSTVGTKLRPGAVPCLATEQDIERERARVEMEAKEYRKKLVDELIKKETDLILHEPCVRIKLEKESPTRDPIHIDNSGEQTVSQDLVLKAIYKEDFQSDDETEDNNLSFQVENYEEKENQQEIAKMISEEEPEENLEENLEKECSDVHGLKKDIDILLRRNKLLGQHAKLKLMLDISNEYHNLCSKNILLEQEVNEHKQKIEALNQQIEEDKIYRDHVKQQLENLKPFEIENNIQDRPRRLWTKHEIEIAMEAFLKNGREYELRSKTEFIPSVRTLQKWRRDHFPMRKKEKYHLFCTEDTVERGVKNLGFEIETVVDAQKCESLLPKLLPTAGKYIFPEDTKERGVNEILDETLLSLNGIILYDHCQNKEM